MIKRILIILLVTLVSIGCIDQLYAQSFPLTVKIAWDPNPASDAVTNYIVVFNGGAPVNFAPSSCTALVCELGGLNVPVAGIYTAQVTAVNQWGAAPSGTASVQISVPGKSNNVKITK